MPILGATYDADLAPMFQKKALEDAEVVVPVVKPVDPNAPFPKLPTVEAILNSSEHTASSIGQEVAKIQNRMKSLEQEDRVKLAEKKAAFEAELRSEEQAGRDVIATNVNIATHIGALQKGNQALRQNAKDLQAENKALYTELRSAAAKVSAGGEFIKASLKATDDRKAKALAVLSNEHKKKPLRPVDADLDEASMKETEDAAPSSDDSSPVVNTAEAEEETNTNEDTKVLDVAPTGKEDHTKPKGLRGVFAHRAGNDVQKKDDDDDDKDDDDKDDKDDGKDDGPESFLMVSRRSMRENAEESSGMDSEEEAGDGDQETRESRSDENSWHHGQGFHHHLGKAPDAAVDGASKAP